jgi:hypothetical protein
VERSHQRRALTRSLSKPEAISPSHLRPPSSGAGTFLPQAGGQLRGRYHHTRTHQQDAANRLEQTIQEQPATTGDTKP